MINELKIDELIIEGCLVTAGTIDNFNTMTIGWGMIGTIWRKKTFIVYVKPCRYTYQFMENNDYFTVSFYDKKYKKEMGYLGSKSGKDCNKVQDVNFHPIEVNNSITFEEAKYTIICKKYYHSDINRDNVLEEDINRYYLNEDVHRVYYGEILEIIEHNK